MAAKRVLVVLSGRIDSLVTAALLKTQGYDVTGVHVEMFVGDENPIKKAAGPCSEKPDMKWLKQMCAKFEIPLHVVNQNELYQQEVLDYVVAETLQMRVANPCIRCTAQIKIATLIKKADELKCEWVATGHYAKSVRNTDGTETNLYKSVDKERDQSYFLFSLSQSQLSRLLMPLGDLVKSNVTKMAFTFGIQTDHSQRKENKEICYVRDGGAIDLVTTRTGEKFRYAGPISNQEGQVMARHTGLYKHWIGQNPVEALSPSDQKENYVIGAELKLNTLIVGPEKDLHRSGVLAINCNWIGLQDFSKGIKAKARITPWQSESDCQITLLNNNSVLVDFSEPQKSVTPGQAIVFYHEDLVIGGGWIEALTTPITSKLKRPDGK